MQPVRHRTPEARQALVVWLSLAAGLACAVMLLGVESNRESAGPLQIKSSKPAAATSSKSTPRPPAAAHAALPQTIRVNVTPGGMTALRLRIRGDYSVRLPDTEKILAQGEGLKTTLVQSTSHGIRIGENSFASTELEIVPQRDPGLEIENHLYRGVIRLYRRKDGFVSAVNVLPLDDYLASVVDSEMPAAFPAAARQAQAIVSRTYALYHKRHANPAAVYDLFSSQRSQKYLGVEYTAADGRRLAGESESSRRVVAETKDQVCTDRGELFSTYYSAVCGGRTTLGAELFSDAAPTLKSVECDWCRASPHYRWKVEIDRREFIGLFVKPETVTAKLTLSVESIAPAVDGAISRFRVHVGRKSFDVTGVELRDRLASGRLRSPHFTIHVEQDTVRFEGRGHGHGAGFCQWGARGQALAGRTAQTIVQSYYPGAVIERAKDASQLP